MKALILSIVLLMSYGAIAQADNALISPKAAFALTAEKKAVIVDVREDDEWNAGHIAGAIHIPLHELTNHLTELAQYKNSPVITQCHSGKRSLKALELLKASGFTDVQSMDGGIEAWTNDGLAIQLK